MLEVFVDALAIWPVCLCGGTACAIPLLLVTAIVLNIRGNLRRQRSQEENFYANL